jgi:protein-L-isoaspartate(D-aspartate) O-methyltransferase
VVAVMSALSGAAPGKRILEVGTGPGYQAAVLAAMGAEVYTIEIVEPLARQAEAVLRRIGYAKVHTRIGDGWAGWPEAAPFDAIVVTAAPERVPPALLEQLGSHGRLVIPVGPLDAQELRLYERDGDRVEQKKVFPVRFVPMTGGAERSRRGDR